MASRSRLQIAKADIVAYLDQLDSHVLRLRDFGHIVREQRPAWRLAVNTTGNDFIAFLLKTRDLKRFEFKFPQKNETLYVWKRVPTMEMFLHLKAKSYFSHFTAMRMHGLTEQVPSTIYISHERSSSHRLAEDEDGPEAIEQDRVDAAFQQPARVTSNVAEFGDRRIVLINGAFTGQLAVEEETLNMGADGMAKIRRTNLERTLIEAAAKPWYSGGVAEVAKAFELAKPKVSVNRIGAMLRGLRYVYPFHQAIGYYMERAGYRSSQLDLMRRYPMRNDFYLDHAMSNPTYVKEWRLYVPAGF